MVLKACRAFFWSCCCSALRDSHLGSGMACFPLAVEATLRKLQKTTGEYTCRSFARQSAFDTLQLACPDPFLAAEAAPKLCAAQASAGALRLTLHSKGLGTESALESSLRRLPFRESAPSLLLTFFLRGLHLANQTLVQIYSGCFWPEATNGYAKIGSPPKCATLSSWFRFKTGPQNPSKTRA